MSNSLYKELTLDFGEEFVTEILNDVASFQYDTDE